jgi:hypothetical protein
MWPVVVVVVEPVFGECADFCQRVEDVAVQYAVAVGAIEAFDIGVLGWLPFLDEL